ncbi:5201_t:CDS:2 [Acaulospora morrowiae]|uniref:5201_t:CDS:1 n=1 Tax=Acaulospora morrowiae TaxID=94023 RepID=A0A9N9AGA8_9GLOM|nr:5201_t:CDS:2 [Acaulospora morrowiae]
MGEKLQAYFDKLLLRIDGLKAVTITDRDAVSSDVSPRVLESAISTTFSVVSDQASKLGLKKNNYVVSLYGIHQIVQFNHAPLITTLVADSNANTGILLDLWDELKELIATINTAILVSQDSPVT